QLRRIDGLDVAIEHDIDAVVKFGPLELARVLALARAGLGHGGPHRDLDRQRAADTEDQTQHQGATRRAHDFHGDGHARCGPPARVLARSSVTTKTKVLCRSQVPTCRITTYPT